MNNEGTFSTKTPPVSPYAGNFRGQPVDLSGSKTAFTCGIIGLFMCWNPVGVVLSMIALVKGGTGKSEYERMPDRFTEKSYRNARSGHSMGLTGLVLFFALYFIVIFAVQLSQ